MQSKELGRAKVTWCYCRGWAGKMGCDQEANIVPVQQQQLFCGSGSAFMSQSAH